MRGATLAAATLIALASMLDPVGALAQSDDSGIELFIVDGNAAKPPVPSTRVARNPLAQCIARPGSAACGALGPVGGSDLESTAGAGGAAQLELLVYDKDGGNVTSVKVAPDAATGDDYGASDDGTYVPPPARTGYAGDVKLPDEYAGDNYDAAPALAISIAFDFGSAGIRRDQRQKIAELGAALSDPINFSAPFAVIGHTDAVGGYANNCELSSRRATAVMAALQEGWNLPLLVSIGAGEHALIDASNPEAAENRRVGFLRIDDGARNVIVGLTALCRG